MSLCGTVKIGGLYSSHRSRVGTKMSGTEKEGETKSEQVRVREVQR